MKKDYLALWGLLAAAFAIFLGLSTCDDIHIGGLHLRSSGMADSLLASASPVVSDDPGERRVRLPLLHQALDEKRQAPLDTVPKTILFIGDSMLDGLYPRLAAYCDASADTLYAVIWYSSTSEAWGKSTKLKEYIQRLKPGYVFICLGSNELFVKDIASKRTKYVREMVSQIGDIPYLWIGPPNWKDDTGVNEMIRSNTAEGCFFLSRDMQFERRRDGAHPTPASAALWMDSIVRWMPAHSPHPIRLNEPDKPTGRARRVFTHSPQEIK